MNSYSEFIYFKNSYRLELRDTQLDHQIVTFVLRETSSFGISCIPGSQ